MPNDPNQESRLLTPIELAARLSYSARTVRRWTSSGVLPYLGPRGRPRYRWETVVAALSVSTTPRM